MFDYPECDHPCIDDIIDNQKVYIMLIPDYFKDKLLKLQKQIMMAKSFVDTKDMYMMQITILDREERNSYRVTYLPITDSFQFHINPDGSVVWSDITHIVNQK